jgi:hypothetical protein
MGRRLHCRVQAPGVRTVVDDDGPETQSRKQSAIEQCFQKMARFCPLAEIPEAVTGHVRRCLGLDPETVPDHGAARTAKWHRSGRSNNGTASGDSGPRTAG